MSFLNCSFCAYVFLQSFTPLIGVTMESLGFPSVDELVTSITNEVITSLNIIIQSLIPALGIGLIIRKISS